MDKKQVVHVLVHSSEEKVNSFIDIVSSEYPDQSEVYRYLAAMQLSKIATYGGKMLGKQEFKEHDADIAQIKTTL